MADFIMSSSVAGCPQNWGTLFFPNPNRAHPTNPSRTVGAGWPANEPPIHDKCCHVFTNGLLGPASIDPYPYFLFNKGPNHVVLYRCGGIDPPNDSYTNVRFHDFLDDKF